MLFALLGGRPLHTDALGLVPTSYLPTGGFVHSLDARVDDPSACCRVRRGPMTSHSRVSSVMRRRAYATCSSENLDCFIWSHSFVVDHRSAGDPKQRKSPSTAVRAADCLSCSRP